MLYFIFTQSFHPIVTDGEYVMNVAHVYVTRRARGRIVKLQNALSSKSRVEPMPTVVIVVGVPMVSITRAVVPIHDLHIPPSPIVPKVFANMSMHE